MEKFALFDFLKAFGSLTENTKAENEAAAPPPPQQQPTVSPAPMPVYERNPMADVIARHEEIANRIRNKK